MHGSSIRKLTMQGASDIVPGGGTNRPSSSLVMLACKFIGGLYRLCRVRGRVGIALFITLFLIVAYMVKQYASFVPLNYTVSQLEDNPPKATIKKHKFHLLIPAQSSSLELCKTLVSAAILKYPPPTLVGYGSNDTEKVLDGKDIEDTLQFLLGKEAEDADIALVVNDRIWFQLPAQVMVDRFETQLQNSNVRLLAKYGALKSVAPEKMPQGRFTERIIFGAEKSCIDHNAEDPACYASPLSPLPEDIYGFNTDKPPSISNNRPRYIYSPNIIGRVGDLREMLKYVHQKMGTRSANSSTQYTFSEVFEEQELKRENARRKSLSPLYAFKEWLMRKNFSRSRGLLSIDKLSLKYATDIDTDTHDFGIGLDYSSSIFQVLDNSVNDVHFITFNHPILVNSPSRLSASAFGHPIDLPHDLKSSIPPYKLHSRPVQGPVSDIFLLEADKLPINKRWADLDLATNIMVPGTEIPCSLSLFGEGTSGLEVSWWKKMWYQPKARALMRRHMRSATGHIAAEAAEKGGETWWDLRGGKGGVWTDKGQYLEWQEVCGKYDEAIFGDGMGKLGDEDGSSQPMYDKFGKLITRRSGL